MQIQFQMRMAAAQAMYDAALALDRRVRVRPDPAGSTATYSPPFLIPVGAAGKYWQSYVNESNGLRVNNDIVTLGGLIKRNAAPQSPR
jgi:hypothetical protein